MVHTQFTAFVLLPCSQAAIDKLRCLSLSKPNRYAGGFYFCWGGASWLKFHDLFSRLLCNRMGCRGCVSNYKRVSQHTFFDFGHQQWHLLHSLNSETLSAHLQFLASSKVLYAVSQHLHWKMIMDFLISSPFSSIRQIIRSTTDHLPTAFACRSSSQRLPKPSCHDTGIHLDQPTHVRCKFRCASFCISRLNRPLLCRCACFIRILWAGQAKCAFISRLCTISQGLSVWPYTWP